MKSKIFQNKLLLLLFTLLIPLSGLAKLQNSTTVLITGDLIDDSKYSWSPNYILVYPDGWSHNIRFNINPYTVPAKGRFIIPEQVGNSDYINLVTTGSLPFDVNICTFFITADSPTHATMKLISTNNSTPVRCSFTGDPNTNTAAIIITNQPPTDY